MINFNKKNIFFLLVFLLSIGLLAYDLFTIITNFNSTWTPFGIITFCISAVVAELSYENLSKK